MIRALIVIRAIVLPVAILGAMQLPVAAATAAQANHLRGMMQAISARHDQIAQRQVEAVAIRETLTHRRNVLQFEVWDEFQSVEAQTESEVFENARLWYSLLLLTEIEALVNRYNEKIEQYRSIRNHLNYLYQQAQDDLKIVTTLPGMTLAVSFAQTEAILEAYQHDAEAIVIHPDTLVLDPPHKMWKKLIQTQTR